MYFKCDKNKMLLSGLAFPGTTHYLGNTSPPKSAHVPQFTVPLLPSVLKTGLFIFCLYVKQLKCFIFNKILIFILS